MSQWSVSIGICAHNEEQTIGSLLDQVMTEDIPVAEVIVVVAGDDATADIVAGKQEEDERIVLVEEGEREGQIAAQNKFLDRASGDTLLFLDGDGTIRSGSLEALYTEFDGNVVAGREIPVTDRSFIGAVIDCYGRLHHRFCLENPRFSTHLGMVPATLVESFPEDIVLDDAFIEHQALENGINIEYVPEAVKYHSTPNSTRFFFHQQKKNWAGRFQAEEHGRDHTKPASGLARTFFRHAAETRVRNIPMLLALGALELAAYTTARYHQFTGNFPVKWWRPPIT